MKISVLIPAYHAALTIEKTIESVFSQTYQNWELVVVEDGSHDGSEEIVRRLADTTGRAIRYENSGINRGVSSTRNRLLDLATGDAVAFLDADDLWSTDHLDCGARSLAAGADLVASGVRTFDPFTGTPLTDVIPPRELKSSPVKTLFAKSVIITSSSVFLSRKMFEKVGPFDLRFSVGEDRDYWLRAALAGATFAIQPQLTCQYAKHRNSTMAQTQLVTGQIVRFYDKYSNLSAIPRSQRRRQLARALADQGRLIRRTDPQTSARHLRRAWSLTPANVSLAAQFAFSVFLTRKAAGAR